MKILIIGINGFIGSHLTTRLLKSTPHKIVGIDLYDHRIKGMLGDDNLDFYQVDFTQHKELVAAKIEECDVVLPLAAIATPKAYVQSPLQVFELDFEANLWIVRACVKYQKRLLFPSTSEVYGMCTDTEFDEEKSDLVLGPIHKTRWIYSCSKQLLDRIIWSYGEQGLEYTIFRPFNWIGSQQDSIHDTSGFSRVITQFIGNIMRDEPIQLVEGGYQKRSFLDISDGISAILNILENREDSRNEIFNIGHPDNEYSIRELAQLIMAKMQPHLPEHNLSLDATTKTTSAEKHYGRGYQDMDRRVPSIAKIQSRLNWSPTIGLEKSLDHIIQSYLLEMQRVSVNV